jgi:hypothetical protein
MLRKDAATKATKIQESIPISKHLPTGKFFYKRNSPPPAKNKPLA